MTTYPLSPLPSPAARPDIPQRPHRRFRRRLRFGFGLAFAVLLLVAGLVTHSLNSLIDDASRMGETRHVISQLHSVMGGVANAETAQRGYALTGRESFLWPYYQSRPTIADSLQQIAHLTADNQLQRQQTHELQHAVDDKLAYVDHLIELRRQQGEEAARATIASGVGQLKMDEVRRLAEVMIATEEALLRERAASTSAAASYSRMIVYTGVGVTLAALLFIMFLVVAEARRRSLVEAELGRANERLQKSMAKLQRVHAEQVLLSDMSELLHGCRSLTEAYRVIERFLPRLFPELNGALGMLNASGNLVEVVSTWGQEPGTQDQFAPEDCWALRRGRPHLVRSATTDVACAHALTGDHACLCHPLLAQSGTGGMLFLNGPSNTIDDAGRRLAQAVGEQISLALANLRLHERLRMQSIRDPLTGLYNRRYMEASLQRELARARRHGHGVGVLMCDIDHFKRFNDTYGHEAGDALLVEFAKLLRSRVREDDIICRYGGEEFVLILPDTDQDAAARRADTLRQAVHELRVQHRGQQLGKVTLSLGVSAFPVHGTSPEALCRSADAALYQAKRSGRDRICIAQPAVSYA